MRAGCYRRSFLATIPAASPARSRRLSSYLPATRGSACRPKLWAIVLPSDSSSTVGQRPGGLGRSPTDGVGRFGEARHRTPSAALSLNRFAIRMYRRSMAADSCPVCFMIERSVFPALAADVASPARSECPE